MNPLAGITILDLTRLLPGPAATMHLADFGADVIKVEDTGDGDYMRGFPPQVAATDGRVVNPAFEAANRGKRSISLDLKRREGREVLLRLVERADALIEGFRPGVLDRLGLGWDTLHARNPKLVLCSLSGYGQTGPLAQRAGHDINYLAMTGVLDQIRAGGKVAIPGLQIGDLLGGTLSALSALLIALLSAARSGRGTRVDVAMTDSLLTHHFFPHTDVDAGTAPQAERTLLTGGVACYRAYTTADGKQIALGALEFKFWKAFCQAAGLEELIERHWSYGEAAGSPEALETIARVAARIAQQTCDEWMRTFESVDACVTPVLRPAAALSHPHHKARGLVHRKGGVTEVGPFAQIEGARWQERPAPRSGQHTKALLGELGYADDEIGRLLASGAARAS
jgi:crotonobetainyl-CoA:carnitine CoA-transferase CaiB-like acyl-CoA transferase